MEGGDGCITGNVLNTSQLYNKKMATMINFCCVYFNTTEKKKTIVI